MIKRPFYEIVLGKMEARVFLVSTSQRAESEIREFGDIPELSEEFAKLPRDKKCEVVSQLYGFIERLSSTGDAAYTRMYLRNLIVELEK